MSLKYISESDYQYIEPMSSINLGQEISNYMESFYEEGYITESSGNKLFASFKRFLASILSIIENITETVIDTIQDTVSNVTLQSKLKKYRKELINMKEGNQQHITSIDIEKYKNTYLNYYNSLLNIGRGFDKSNYTHASQIDADLKKFEKISKKYDEELDRIAKEKKPVKVSTMLKFVDKELSSKSEVVSTIYKTKNLVKEIERNSNKMRIEKFVAGKDIIPKKMGLIRRFLNKITKFIKIRVVSFIALIVFAFA